MAHPSTVPSQFDDATASASELEAQHRGLALYNRTRLVPSHEARDFDYELRAELAFRRLERELLTRMRGPLRAQLRDVPRGADAFIAWFERLEHDGPGQGDPLFPWLRDQATLAQMRWFLRQETAGEAGFDDLVALPQVRLHASEDDSDVVWESLALGNLMIALAMNRELAYQSIGALGAIELTAPGRAERVNAGLKRLGVAGDARRYDALHAALDRRRSAAWNVEVLRPLIERDPACTGAIAEGALLRLSAGARCFDRYRRELEFGPRAVLPCAPG